MRCETPHRPYCSFSFLFCTQYWWPEGYFCNLPPIVYTANLLFRPCSDNMCSSFTAFIKWERHRTNQIVSDRCLFVRAVFCCILSVFATSYTEIIRQSLCCVVNTTNQCLTRYSRVLAVYIHTGSLDDWFWTLLRSDQISSFFVGPIPAQTSHRLELTCMCKGAFATSRMLTCVHSD